MIKRIVYLTFLISLWMGGMSVDAVVKSSVITLFVTYILIPFLFHFSPYIQRHLIFLTFVNYPWKIHFDDPATEGLPGTRNFYLKSGQNVKIGVWQILPESKVKEAPNKHDANYEQWYLDNLSDGKPVVIYLHGNTSSRAVGHRIELYQMLRKLDFHVITFDYRGYADSSKVTPTEDGMVEDAKTVYYYVCKRITSKPIIWGHSLGTGVSCHTISDVCLEGNPPQCLILESPFNNIKDEVTNHPLSSFYRKMPKFEWLFLQPLKTSGIDFQSDQHVCNICVPILFLHAKDDLVIPHHLGEKLYAAARKNSKFYRRFVAFESNRRLGHKFICRAPELPQILIDFLAGYEDN